MYHTKTTIYPGMCTLSFENIYNCYNKSLTLIRKAQVHDTIYIVVFNIIVMLISFFRQLLFIFFFLFFFLMGSTQVK
jgi:hypothetical protein